MKKEYYSYTVEKQYKNLQHFVKEKLNLSLKETKRLIDKGACLLNSKIERFGSKKIKQHDTVQISKNYKKALSKTNVNILVLYEDEYFLAIDKPVDFVCSDIEIHKYFPKKYLLIHRLDKDVTGVLLIAKNSKIKDKFINIFKNKSIQKTYLAIVDGKVLEKNKIIEKKIAKINSIHGQTIYGVKKEGRFALTKLELIKTKNDISLVQLTPITGRTHQLRIHMKEISHPILGDYLYSKKFKYKPFINRIMLHASKVDFIHPLTDENIVIRSKYPKDFSDIITI